METHALTTDVPAFGQLRQRGLIVGIVGLAAGVLGGFLEPGHFLPAWLIGFMFCLGMSMGCLAMLMLQHMSGGQWGLVTRRIFEAGSRLVPFCLLLYIPIGVLLPKMYAWARPEAVAADHILQWKAIYLNVPFALIRVAVYFGVWIFCMYYLNRWSAQQDRGEVAVDELDTRRFRVISGPGLVFYVVLMTLGSVDWLMSLDPHWYSTMFGFIIVVGQGLAALALASAVLAIASPFEPMSSILKKTHVHDVGKLMLAFVMLWAYMSFSQFLIIWAGNLPEEIPFYLQRFRGGWGWVSVALALGHFALPFCLLLSRDLKRHPRLLARVAWFILAMRLLDLIWIVSPNFRHGNFGIHWIDVALPVGMAGIWMFLFAGQLVSRPLLPVNDPYWKEMLAHEHAAH
jgi:hypothetical protein